MQNRKVFVLKDVNYGASKASSTVATALNPADLADGAVGIYGIQLIGSTNVNKLVLITDGGSEGAGTCPAASFGGKEVFIAQGVPLTAGGVATTVTNQTVIFEMCVPYQSSPVMSRAWVNSIGTITSCAAGTALGRRYRVGDTGTIAGGTG